MGGTLKPLFTWRSAISDSELSSTHRHVAIALSLYMSERGDSAHPGPSRLAQDTGLHVSTVKEKLADLERLGWLRCIVRGGRRGQRRQANEYVAAFPDPPLFSPEPVAVGDPSPGTTGRRGCGDPSPSPRLPVAVGDPISSENSPENSSGESTRTRRKRRTEIPEQFEVDERMVAWVTARYPNLDWNRESEKFVSWAKANGELKADWVQAWRNWMHRAADGRYFVR